MPKYSNTNKNDEKFVEYKEINEERAERLITECLIMINKIKKNSALHRVYSDVNFYRIIENIQEQRKINEEIEHMEWLCGI